MLFSGSWKTNADPPPPISVRSIHDLGFVAPNRSRSMRAYRRRPARNFATSSKIFPRSEEHTSELQSPDQHSVPTRRSSDLAGQRGGESDVGAPDDVVLGLLEDERRPAASDQRPEHPRPRIRRAEPLTEHARVQAPTRAKLCDLLEDLPKIGRAHV